jgi:hypothetical protein
MLALSMKTKVSVWNQASPAAGSSSIHHRFAALIAGLAVVVQVHGQGNLQPLSITFDGLPEMPPSSSRRVGYYFESGVGVIGVGAGFTRRWSGDPMFPDNGTAYLQPASSEELFFTYAGGHRFGAVSVDLALYSTASLEPIAVRFVGSGYRRGIDIIATTEFNVAGNVDNQGRPVFQTFYFGPEFTGLLYLSVMPIGPLWSLDNLVISVPEPSAGTLLLAGGAILWAMRRRQRNGPIRCAQRGTCRVAAEDGCGQAFTEPKGSEAGLGVENCP